MVRSREGLLDQFWVEHINTQFRQEPGSVLLPYSVSWVDCVRDIANLPFVAYGHFCCTVESWVTR